MVLLANLRNAVILWGSSLLLGNDLGRVLRWGAGYSGEDPYSILVSVDEADDVLMDRWTILLDAEEPVEGAENGVAEPEPPKVSWTPFGSDS